MVDQSDLTMTVQTQPDNPSVPAGRIVTGLSIAAALTMHRKTGEDKLKYNIV